jgi:hypothetical protein
LCYISVYPKRGEDADTWGSFICFGIHDFCKHYYGVTMTEFKPNPLIANETKPYWNSYNQQWTCQSCGKINYGTAALCECFTYKMKTIDVTVGSANTDTIKYDSISRIEKLEQQVKELQEQMNKMRTTFRTI